MVRLTTSWVGIRIDQLDRAGLRRELAVGLVDDQDAAGLRCQRLQQGPQVIERNALSRRVVRAGDEDDVRIVFLDRGRGDVRVEAEVVGAVGLQPPGLGAVGDDRVHRVRRHEADCAAARTAERLQQLLQDLVGTVGRPDVLDADGDAGLRRQVGGQVGAQRDRVAVGIAVQLRGRRPHRLGRRRRSAPASADAGSRWCSAAPGRSTAVRRTEICRAGRRAAADRRG